jgi:MFS family permease
MILYGTFFDGPATSVYLAKSTRRDKLMFTYALWSASVSLGSIFSPSLGGFLASTIGMQAVFLIAFAFYFGSMCPLFFIKNQPPVEDVTPTMPSSENRSSKTLLVLICCFFSVAMFSIFMLNPLIPQFEDEVYNQSFLNIGIFGAVTSAGSALFSIIIGKIGDKWTKMAAIASSLIITSFSFLLLILFNNFLFLCVASLLTGASAPILYFMVGIIASIAPKRFEGRWVSIAQMAVTIAGFVAPIVGGVLYEFSPSVPFYLLIVTAPCLAAVALAFSKHLRSE